MRRLLPAALALVVASHAPSAFQRPAVDARTKMRFVISYGAQLGTQPVDGRLLLMLSSQPDGEPRFQIDFGPTGQPIFGIDVEGLQPGEEAVIDDRALGFPIDSIAQIPAGTYTVQALLHRYETFHRGDGKTVKMPMDRGEGQQWNRAPGNLFSTPRRISIDPGRGEAVEVTLDNLVGPIAPPRDTTYVRHETIRSEKLSKFWGRPMHLGANVLLPEGWEAHPDVRYPLVIFHGHYPHTFAGFREQPPDAALEPDYSERFKWKGYNRTQQEYAHRFYKAWTGARFPRLIIIEIRHANPFYDDSYAVNSQNVGPYGDAINEELIPFIERKYRAIGQPWARFMYGGSTGGWEAMAAQVLYPDFYNGAYIACPDPIDFRAFTVVNIYEDRNAYYLDSPWKRTPRPGHRNYLGHVSATLEEMNRLELVLGTKTRSGQQWDIWEAVYSPVGADGYPRRIWDKRTGEIDKTVATHWREHYDLSYILRRDWEKGLGRKLEGKLHLYVGDMDNYYLNNAVYLTEEFLEKTTSPNYGGEVDYGDRAEHCWNGDHTQPNAISRLRYHEMFAPKIVSRILKSAPPGADLTGWRY